MKTLCIEYQKRHFLIISAPSCFVSRNGKSDVSVYERARHGRRHTDGHLYKCCLRLAAEDGHIVEEYEYVPITLEWMKNAGFFENMREKDVKK